MNICSVKIRVMSLYEVINFENAVPAACMVANLDICIKYTDSYRVDGIEL